MTYQETNRTFYGTAINGCFWFTRFLQCAGTLTVRGSGRVGGRRFCSCDRLAVSIWQTLPGGQYLIVVPRVIVVLERTIEWGQLPLTNELRDDRMVPISGTGVNTLRGEIAKVYGLILLTPPRGGCTVAHVERDVGLGRRRLHRVPAEPGQKRWSQPCSMSAARVYVCSCLLVATIRLPSLDIRFTSYHPLRGVPALDKSMGLSERMCQDKKRTKGERAAGALRYRCYHLISLTYNTYDMHYAMISAVDAGTSNCKKHIHVESTVTGRCHVIRTCAILSPRINSFLNLSAALHPPTFLFDIYGPF